ncbi:helix-turn-helix transcriptional regulator [Nocardioides guangzhouensis]|uniref:Helix-turn-helix transcriptional regulator n=1 Tax=Nocardioides guangzhouensis TaxID=2497878 RepID=A0A4Q4ZIP6_9ACTN|nr:helix-turn-helix transcriptional regulator [Nocardioides guangzhouensis]RYP87234.1 helix-turn-helix transcriptional regulator [Nocardioides guangzhouensis]
MRYDDLVAEARSAAAAGRWEQARAAYAGAVAERETAGALDGLGRVCWWLGDVRAAIEHRQHAFRLLVDADADEEAARAAVDLCVWYLTNLDNVVAARGWLARADRAAARAGSDVARGWVVLLQALLDDDPDRQLTGLERARALAVTGKDTALETMALSDLGLVLVQRGQEETGLVHLDEAMTSAFGGLDDLQVVVWSSCNMLAACSLVDDLVRARLWCREADRFMARYGCPFLQARCRAHFGSVLLAAGEWQQAEDELRRALAMSSEVGAGPAEEARLALADLRCRQGRLEEAAELLTGLGHTSRAAVTVAAVDLARGFASRAAAVLRDRLDRMASGDPEVAAVTAALADACLACGDTETAADLVREEAGVWQVSAHARARAVLVRAAGSVAAARGDAEAAARLLAAACDAFREGALPFELGQAMLALAEVTAQRDPDLAAVHGGEALECLTTLGAASEAARAAAFLRSLGVTPSVARRVPGVLTAREREVLALLGQGLSNPEIAARLFLSRKTVAHHVSSVLAKLGMRSRVEAAAYAARVGVARVEEGTPVRGIPDSAG